MAYYNANRMIRLMRLALGMTKEDLCDGICSVMTLSRIEAGGAVKRDTYRQLMARMGRMTGEHYAVCSSRNGGMLEKQEEMERAFHCQDYEQVKQCLSVMKEYADGNVLTAQYIARAEALADFFRKHINTAELLERISSVLRMTVPEYEKYLKEDKVFPFVKEELSAVMNLGFAYMHTGDVKNSLHAYQTVMRCLDAGYIGPPDHRILMIKNKFHISQLYEFLGKNEEALKEIDDCLALSMEIDYGHMLAKLLVSKAHYYMKQANKKEAEEAYFQEAKQYLLQAYYIAAARKDAVLAITITEYYEKHFGKWTGGIFRF